MKHPTANFLRCSNVAKRSRLFAVGLAMTALVLSSAQLGASPRSDTLQAINWVENPSNSTRPGAYGELGPYQFRESTWQMHTQRPFIQATDRHASEEVAIAHYEWVKTTLERAGVEPTTYNIALAWNAGVNAVIKNRAPAVAHNYATRVNNLATDLGHQLVAAK